MDNINEELKRIKLLFSYDTNLTLNENYKINLLSENDDITFILNEQPRSLFRTLLGDIKGISSQVKDFSLFKGDIAAAEKFLQDASAGRAGAKELGTFTKDVLKDGSRIKNSKPGLFQGASESYAKNLFSNTTDDIAKQFKNATDADKRSLLKNAGYPEASINSIIKDYNIIANSTKEVAKTTDVVRNINGRVANVKDLKGSSAEVKELIKNVPDVKDAVKNVEQLAVDATQAGLNPSTFQKIGNKIGFYGAAGFNRIKSLASKMSFKKLVLYGLAGYGAFTVLNNLFGDDPNPSVLDPCVVNSDKVEIVPTTSGDIMGVARKTGNEEYDSKGGLKFTPSGKVYLYDNSKKGKYSCSTGGQLKLGESSKKKKINEETILGNIEITWDVPGGGNESSSTGSFKRECGDPYSRGCKEKDPNGPLHKVQSCLDVKSDGLFGGKTEGALLTKTQSKTFMAKDVDKICTSSGGGGTQQPTQDPEYTIDTQNTEAGETDTEGV